MASCFGNSTNHVQANPAARFTGSRRTSSSTFRQRTISFAVVLSTCLSVALTAGADAAQRKKKSRIQSQRAKITSNYDRTVAEHNRKTVSVVSGEASGTYLRFATDLADALETLGKDSMRVLPIAGRGGGQNVLDIMFLRGIDLAITQQDHLTYIKNRNPALYGNIENQIHYITKLYNSELHLIANTSIRSVKDLAGKTVNLSRPLSSSHIAGQTILDLLNIDANVVHIDTEQALRQVQSGKIAATVMLAGAPVKGFMPSGNTDKLHFLPLDIGSLGATDYARLLEVYLPAKLHSEDYPGIIPAGQSVPTIASGTMLAVYNWAPGTSRYKRVNRFVRAFFANFKKFKAKPYHPKWKEINIAASVPGWKRFKAAQRWLDKNAKRPAPQVQAKVGHDLGAATGNDAFSAFLNQAGQSQGTNNLSPKQKDALFTQFTRWWQSQQKR